MNNLWTERLPTTQTHWKPRMALVISLCPLGAGALLSGCGVGGAGGSSVSPTAPAGVRITGSVHGGQQPVSGSTIQLYAVGTTGLKSASTAMLTATVQSDANGSFSLAGLFNCSTLPATQVYITATGGNPGAGTNSALTMAAALGPCTGLTASTFINIDEITTVAAAYALAPFTADLGHIGAGGSNPAGLVNAFTNAGLLANTSSGTAGGAALAAGVAVPTTEINTLGDIISSCVNTNGAASTYCTALFSATGASDTFAAALAIARNPGASAITGLYSLVQSTGPFEPTLSAPPNDFSVAVTSTGNGGLATPYGIAIDGSGNAWVTNESGSTVSELGVNAGLIVAPTATGLVGAQGVAVDRGGNVWVANTAGNSVVKFALTAGAITGSNSFTAGGITGPTSIAIDSASNVFVANFNGNTVTGLNSAGAPLSGSPFNGGNNISLPTSVAVSPTGTVYVTSGNGSVINLANTGGLIASLSDGTLQGPQGVAVDSKGQILVTGFTTGASLSGALSQFIAAGTAVSGSPYTAGLSSPAGIASDGVSIWIANDVAAGGLVRFNYTSSAPTSPVPGFGLLNSPVGVAIDASGSVWTTNSASNTVSKFIGLAVPVATPIAVNVGP